MTEHNADEASSYTQGKTVKQVAEALAGRLLTERVNDETAYGMGTNIVVTLTLSGGGPGSHIEFTFDGSTNPEYIFEETPDAATFAYYEWGARAEHKFDSEEAERLWRRFMSSPEEPVVVNCWECGDEITEGEDFENDDNEDGPFLCEGCREEASDA